MNGAGSPTFFRLHDYGAIDWQVLAPIDIADSQVLANQQGPLARTVDEKITRYASVIRQENALDTAIVMQRRTFNM